MKTIVCSFALAAYSLLTPVAAAEPVTYWFSGYVDDVYNISNSLPFEVALGTPVAGRISYDPAAADSGFTTNTAGKVGNHYFSDPASFSAVLQFAGHTVTGGTAGSGPVGILSLYDDYDGSDLYHLETSRRAELDGTPFLSGLENSQILLDLYDNSQMALADTVIPSNPPSLASYQDQKTVSWLGYYESISPAQLFIVQAVLTNISTNEQVLLHIESAASNTVEIRWPSYATGFALQSTTGLVQGPWVNVTNSVSQANGHNTVSLPINANSQFFRLKK